MSFEPIFFVQFCFACEPVGNIELKNFLFAMKERFQNIRLPKCKGVSAITLTQQCVRVIVEHRDNNKLLKM